MNTDYSCASVLIPVEKIFSQGQNHYKYTWLYHYTSLTTLIKILKSGRLRFSRIDLVNDRQEKLRLMQNENYKRTYIACFSKKAIDSIPMWMLYSPRDTGVMLGFHYKKNANAEDLFVYDYMENGNEKYLLSNGAISNNNDYYFNMSCFDVDYCNQDKLTPIMNIVEEGKTYNIPDHFCREKSKAWEYECETRFRATLFTKPFSNIGLPENLEYVYAKINFMSIDKISITFSPWADKTIWEPIIHKYLVNDCDIKVPIIFKNSRLFEQITIPLR